MTNKDFRFGISSSVGGVDLNQLLVKHPLSTYFMKVASDIPELSLLADDIVVVDRSLTPKKNDFIVAASADDPELKIIQFHARQELEVWGVVTRLIRGVRP